MELFYSIPYFFLSFCFFEFCGSGDNNSSSSSCCGTRHDFYGVERKNDVGGKSLNIFKSQQGEMVWSFVRSSKMCRLRCVALGTFNKERSRKREVGGGKDGGRQQ